MEGLRELRGMVVFPAEETTRGYSCYSGDHADYAATPGLHSVMRNTSYETYKLHRLRGQDNLHVTMRDYARLRPEATRALLQFHGHHSSFMLKKKAAHIKNPEPLTIDSMSPALHIPEIPKHTKSCTLHPTLRRRKPQASGSCGYRALQLLQGLGLN